MTEKKQIEPGYIKKETMLVAILIALGVGFLGGATLSSFKFKQEETPSFQSMPQQVVQQENPMTPELANKISALEMETSSNPEDAGAWAQLGNLYFDTNQFGEAINAYKKSLAVDPDDPDIWTDLGVMYRRNGQPIQAVEAFDKAIELDPSHEISRLNKGIVLMHDLNDIQGAITVWEELVKVNPAAKTSTGQLIKDVIAGFKAREGQ